LNKLWRAAFGILACAVLSACGGSKQEGSGIPDYPAFVAQDGLEEQRARFADVRLPQPSDEQVEEVRELLELAAISGRNGNQARSRLSSMPVLLRNACMLALVEELTASLEQRQSAYLWMYNAGVAQIVPRLTLRLKYEKDSWSAVCLAQTLLYWKNGAGLDALAAVLERDARDSRDEAARAYAAEVILQLPARDGWNPGESFASDWQRLTEVRDHWNRRRLLDPSEVQSTEFPAAIEAELWEMMTRFRSMPLRPVDDARFVCVRQRLAVVPLLLQAARDPDRYVREHALQTLSWIGAPISAWRLSHDFDYLGQLEDLMGDAALRTRIFEAAGASGDPAASALLEDWVQWGNREQSAAAADALLRCAGPDSSAWLDELLANSEDAQRLAPEARYSLELLAGALDGTPLDSIAANVAPEVRDALPEGERSRRERWLAERELRVKAE